MPVAEPRFGTVVLVAAVGAAATLVLGVLALGFGVRPGPHPITLAAGVGLFAAGLYMFQRGLRRRARMRAIERLLPHHRERRRYRDLADAAVKKNRRFIDDKGWMLDETEWTDDGADAPLGRSEMRAATRALLVSLEEELRRDAVVGGPRSTRPACRRARLRAAGRVKTGRRRRPHARPLPVQSVS
jgi:hypothetical protein